MSTILIVDDDETVLELITATVRFLGYTALSTIDPTQTFRILEKNSIDLILLDVHMPVLDGITLLRQIRSHPVYKKIPVIMLTIDEETKLLERCFESGAADFITKPAKKLVLKSRIKSALSIKEYISKVDNLNKNLEKEVEERTMELQEQKKSLEQKNIALREILEQIELEKKQIKDNVISNAENLILPTIQKLKLTGVSRKYIKLLQANIHELTSSFGVKLTERSSKLTNREIELCNMIKNGLTSKEISKLLSISLGTVENHRNNIRRKLNIVNKDANLSSVLKTL